VRCSALQCVAVRCSALQCVAFLYVPQSPCRESQGDTYRHGRSTAMARRVCQCVTEWCSVMQCGAVWCNVVQCGARCRSNRETEAGWAHTGIEVQSSEGAQDVSYIRGPTSDATKLTSTLICIYIYIRVCVRVLYIPGVSCMTGHSSVATKLTSTCTCIYIYMYICVCVCVYCIYWMCHT